MIVVNVRTIVQNFQHCKTAEQLMQSDFASEIKLKSNRG